MKLTVKQLRSILSEALYKDQNYFLSIDDQVDKFLISLEDIKVIDKTAEKQNKKLDIDHFAKGVARLYQHYDNLLDIPNSILRRSLKYIEKNFDKETSKALEDLLERDYKIGLNVRDVDYDIESPKSAESGPVGAELAGGA